jgi:hypothetical protein
MLLTVHLPPMLAERWKLSIHTGLSGKWGYICGSKNSSAAYSGT